MGQRSDLPVHPLIDQRYSPRAFSDRVITDEELQLLLEAARWAPSSFNEQPWRFVIVRKGGTGHTAMLEALNASNRIWAAKAPVLILALTRTTMERNGNSNPHARHDLGLAVAQLTLQATETGLGIHQLAGFDPALARNSFNVPDAYDLVSILVIGFHGEPDDLPDNLRDRELRRSTRRPLDELIHYGRFGSEP